MTAPLFSRLRDRVADEDVDTDALSLTHADDHYRLTLDGEVYEELSENELWQILANHPAHLQEWNFWQHQAPQDDARWAFLRWLEEAENTSPPERRTALTEGHAQTWGQLHITVRLDANDDRTYALRHVDDAAHATDALDQYTDLLEARRLAKYDDEGRYRPLSTAPTLQTGWVFADLNASALLQTIDFFYPATIANWYRERIGELDVSHWADTTDRQTGIYAVTNELEGEAVDWVAETCCADSQCLKRREWDEHEDRELSVPRGDGLFPCREPCSLVIAASRKWVMLEREEEQEYTLHLTPSEKEQLETLLHAVAEGTAGDVREADVRNGANRYRARFLRAKRTNEHGELKTSDDADNDHD